MGWLVALEHGSYRNEMSGLFRLQEAHYFLDGAPLKQMTDVDGNLAKAEELELFQGQIVPGNHQISGEPSLQREWLRNLHLPTGLPV